MPEQTELEGVLQRSGEGVDLDFKSALDWNQPGDRLEIVKDIVAFANSGGGTILLGVDDNGTPCSRDQPAALPIDPADITNQIYKYTGIHFHDFSIIECWKNESRVCAISIGGCRIPIVFSKVGTYQVTEGRQKTAFSVGTVYFRHGAKSEPGTSDDLRAFLEREVEAIKHSWLDGIVKLVEAPAGSRVAIFPPGMQSEDVSGPTTLKLTDDPDAPSIFAIPIDTTHPFRQKEVVEEVNKKLAGRKKINPHDILCVRRAHGIQRNISFCYTQKHVSPRFSQAFVNWIIHRYEEDGEFFEKARADS